MGIPTLMVTGPASGTYTAAPTANRIGVYMYAGGGGASWNGNAQSQGYSGGQGGGGFWNKPITQPFSQPYSVGAAGNTSPSATGPGNAGGATSITNVGTANGGAGATTGGAGAAGTVPGSSLTVPILYRGGAAFNYFSNNNGIYYSEITQFGSAGAGFPAAPCSYNAGKSPGREGALIVFENTGT